MTRTQRKELNNMTTIFKRTAALLMALMVVLSMAGFPTVQAAMKKGSSGTEVRHLQQNLIGLGYLDDEADGRYGTRTAAAVAAFQADFGLNVDGSAGRMTQTALRNAVVRLQVELSKLGHAPGTADGYFGQKTRAALLSFQRSYGLGRTGVADRATWAAINDVSGGMRAGSAVRKGSSGTQVRYLQQALIGLGYLTGSADGVYGSKTEAAVRLFQENYGLSVDGSAGKLTMTALKNAVVTLQSDLARRGFESGTINGVYGTGTTSAVKAYQKYQGITSNGIAGPSTMQALYGYSMGGQDAEEEKTYKIWIDSLYQTGDYSLFWYGADRQFKKTVNEAGCGGVALAMALNALKNTDEYTGKNVMQWMADNNYYQGNGTYQSGLADYPQRLGLKTTYCNTAKSLINHLKQGRLAIALIRDRTGEELFVSSGSRGHYILISGYRSKDGVDQIFVNNPLRNKSSKWFDIDDLMANCVPGYENYFVVIYQ